jgi:hypothetical protein
VAGERLDIALATVGAVPQRANRAELERPPVLRHIGLVGCVAKGLAVVSPELVARVTATARHPRVDDPRHARRRAFMRHLPEDRLQRQMWRRVALQLKQAAADGDTTKVAVSLRMVLSMEGVECRPR